MTRPNNSKNKKSKSMASKAMSGVLATSMAFTMLGVSSIEVALNHDSAYGEEVAEVEAASTDGSDAGNVGAAAEDSSSNGSASDASTDPDNAEQATPETPQAAKPDSVISATVQLDTTGSPTPVTSDPADGEEEEEGWQDTTPEWNWPATDGGWEAWDGSIVSGPMRKGIDVSEHQGWIDWESVSNQGIDFAIIRCGYGSDTTANDDDFWSYNVSECERLGIPYGVYLYSYASSVEDAASEAAHVLRLLEGHSPSMPVYYDLEEGFQADATMRGMLPSFASEFCGAIEGAGYTAGVYANLSWWNNHLTDPVFDNWEKWVAQYNTTCEYAGDYKVWQAGSKMMLDGTTSKYVDVNFDFGGYFRDVDYASDLAQSGALDYVVGSGIMGPVGTNLHFAPSEGMTRAAAVEALYNMAGRPSVGFAGVGNPQFEVIPFDDVAIDSPYAEPVRWARANGIVSGALGQTTSDGAESAGEPMDLFRPDEQITREELCEMMAAYAQASGIDVASNPVNLVTVSDGFDVSKDAIPSVGWSVGSGVLALDDVDGVRAINPSGGMTRGDFAKTMLSLHNAIAQQA